MFIRDVPPSSFQSVYHPDTVERLKRHAPKHGAVVLFDRSRYNRALAEPLFGFCTEAFISGVDRFKAELIRFRSSPPTLAGS